MISESVRRLVCYGLEKGFYTKRDEIYITNRILEILRLDSYDCGENFSNVDLEKTLSELLCYAVENGIIEDNTVSRDLFDTRLMGALIPLPSEVTDKFRKLYAESPVKATEYFYKLSGDSDYIRRYRVARDVKWVTPTEYGDLDITINLSKPEKDPKAIAAAKSAPQSGYPKCLLCKECEGYAGRANFPARQNHRFIPIELAGTDFFLQYSPYVYYNEHCIAFNASHTPMAINRTAFERLLDFTAQFPHYFIGSNADLPIVGGSILSHDHYQGGNYEFAMAKAPVEQKITFLGFEDVGAGIVKWPMSVIRLNCADRNRLADLADKILTAWRGYTDESAFVFALTNGEPHNTITPIARRRGENFELDLVLRNNITTKEHPLGVFHPHSELHHIKKENIGLIEVMGLAVLPSRLKTEMALLSEAMLNGSDISADERIAKHAEWAQDIKSRYSDLNKENIDSVLKAEIGAVFAKVLEYAGVFKRDNGGRQAFMRFIKEVK